MTADPSMPIDLLPNFRMAMRQLAASVAIITTHHEGRRHGMAATAVTSVTTTPPTILVCVNQSASLHAPLLASGRFAVNLLGLEHEPLVPLFSGKLAGESRFEHGAWATGWGGVPVLQDGLAVLACEVTQTLACGSHTVVLGEVRDLALSGASNPLVYHDGAFLRALDSRPRG